MRVIGMDEISYRKRHKYLTVVIDHLSGRVVWAGKERKAKTLKLGPQRAAELEAVSMDMWEPYITVVGKKAPQARVIFDRFHIGLNEAVDKTRRELVRELSRTPSFPFSRPNTTAARKTNGCSASRCELIVASTDASARRLHGPLHLQNRFSPRMAAARYELEDRARLPQPLRWRHRVGPWRLSNGRLEQQNPAAEPPQLWTPLCRSSHQSRLPKLWRSHPREDPLKWQERQIYKLGLVLFFEHRQARAVLGRHLRHLGADAIEHHPSLVPFVLDAP